jgi:hypothetical protein
MKFATQISPLLNLKNAFLGLKLTPKDGKRVKIDKQKQLWQSEEQIF